MPQKIKFSQRQTTIKNADHKNRKADQAFYNSAAWKRARAAHLKDFPCCARCKSKGIVNADRIQVHHIIDRKLCDDPYDLKNLQSLCISCHTTIEKTKYQK